ncbi:MAG TPA: hypothetical protein PLI09_07310 [Candidatus Hydrogenedentes bacterium]|nr:hypothetical protein [Candidatus Hydrogenedentota bacterium]
MLFRKRRVPHALFSKEQSAQEGAMTEWEIITVEFDMMTKGAILQRRGRKIRQFAVMVNGNVRVVTSGDTVDRETFMAMVAADAVRAPWMHPDPPNEIPAKGNE